MATGSISCTIPKDANYPNLKEVSLPQMRREVADLFAPGEQDADAAKAANQTNATMMLMMPLMSLWIGFSMPAAISIYWIAQAVFGAVQDYFLTKHYRKVYDEEDAVKQEIAAKRRAEEAEKERQRALRREQNPDGITDNVSKKKIRQQEKEAAEKAARAYEAKKNPVQESEGLHWPS